MPHWETRSTGGPAAYVLERYGASPITVNPLVGALGDESQREGSITVLTFYRASRVTVKPLVASLGNNLPTRTASIGVLTAYGPSKVTIQPLVGALLELSRKDAAARVILNYGRKALRHIGEPIPGTELFTPLTEIIGLIRAGNP